MLQFPLRRLLNLLLPCPRKERQEGRRAGIKEGREEGRREGGEAGRRGGRREGRKEGGRNKIQGNKGQKGDRQTRGPGGLVLI